MIKPLVLFALVGCVFSKFTREISSFSKEELDKCVSTAASKLRIDESMRTNPILLDNILREDMHIRDMPEVDKLFAEDLKVSKPLKPMLEKVRQGITENHPAVGIALCSALTDSTTSSIFDNPDIMLIRRSVHHMYLLDKIVSKMAESDEFMNKMQQFVNGKVKEMAPHKSFIGHLYDLYRAAGVFGVVKSLTIDGTVSDYKKFREQSTLTPFQVTERSAGLTLNVLEATTTDFLHGYLDNAWVGKVLAGLHPKTIEVGGPQKSIKYVNENMNYARIYETWNLAFITANLDFPNMLYPKLLIPSVIMAGKDDYLFNRVLALWLSINFYLMADLNGQTHIKFDGRDKLATLWGEINKKYVNDLLYKNSNVE
jgi:hypothetical protein